MQVLLKVEVVGSRSLGAVTRRRRAETVFGPGAELGHLPRCTELVNRCLDAGRPLCRPRGHVLKRIRGENLAQGRADASQRQRVASQGAANTPDVDVFEFDAAAHARSEVRGHAERRSRDTAGDAFANDHGIRMQPVCPGHAAWAGRECVGFVDDQNGAVSRAQLADGLVVAGVWQNDADIGQRGFDQHRGDLTRRQSRLERWHVVERHNRRGLGRWHGRADIAAPGNDPAVRVQGRERLIDAAVIAIVVHEDLRPTGDLTRVTDQTSIGVGG